MSPGTLRDPSRPTARDQRRTEFWAATSGAISGRPAKGARGRTLGNEQLRRLLDLLAENSIAVLAIGAADEASPYYNAMLELAQKDGWQWELIPVMHGESGGYPDL